MSAIALGIAGLVIGATGTAMSFGQMGKAKRLQRDAESKADQAMAEARKRLEVNYLDELAIQKEPYELAREASLQQGATALAAAQQGDQRGIAATAGRLEVAQDAAQGQVRSQMGAELNKLDKLVAEEDSRLRDLNVQLDLGEVSGFQAQAANQEQLKNQAMAQGIQGAVGTLQSGLSLVPLYQQNQGAQQQAIGDTQYTQNQVDNFDNVSFSKREGGFLGIGGDKVQYDLGIGDTQAIRDLNPGAYRKFKRQLEPDQSNVVFGSQFQDIYNTQQNLGVADPNNPAASTDDIRVKQAKASGRFMKDDGTGKMIPMTDDEIKIKLGIK
jgi:hypothetical protein